MGRVLLYFRSDRAPMLLGAVALLAPSRRVCHCMGAPPATTATNHHSWVAAAAATARAVRGYTIEVTPAAARRIGSFAPQPQLLRAGARVNVTNLAGADMAECTSTCARLAAAGMRPVAHVPARAFRSLGELDAFLGGLRAAGVAEVLVLGGDAERPGCAELPEALAVLRSGLLQKHGLLAHGVGVAAHPEGHPSIAEGALAEALLRKAAWAQAEGVELYFETQFCFEAAPVIAWERRTRAALREALGERARLPRVRLGVAGPAKVSSLVRFAAFAGVGSSLRFISRYGGNVLKLATTAAPDALVAGVAAHMEKERGDCLIDGFHFFPLGGFHATLRWANAVADGAFAMHDGGGGFDVLPERAAAGSRAAAA